MEKGDYKNAGNTFLRYPRFAQTQPKDLVSIAGHVYTVGSLLFWRGTSQDVVPFFEISANLNTGSSASMTSAQRLAIINKEYVPAAAYAFQNAQRYNS